MVTSPLLEQEIAHKSKLQYMHHAICNQLQHFCKNQGQTSTLKTPVQSFKFLSRDAKYGALFWIKCWLGIWWLTGLVFVDECICGWKVDGRICGWKVGG